MARIYQTRQLLSPEAINLVQNRADYNVNFDKALRDRDSQVYRDYLMTAGRGIDKINDWWAQKNAMDRRQAMAGQWDVGTDPAAVAAKEEYVRTGSSSPLLNYRMQKLAAEQRVIDAAKAAEDKARQDAFHRAVRVAQARPEYSKIQKAMLDAVDAGDMEQAEIYGKQLKAYETEFGADTFGQDAASILEARKKTAEEKAAAAAQEAVERSIDEKKVKEAADKSYEMRNFILDNFMPVGAIKDKNEQIYLANLVRSTNMLDEDKKFLDDRIYGTTKQEGLSKARQSAIESDVNKETGKKLEENREKKKLADDGRAAIRNGLSPTREEQEAINEGY